MILSNRAMVNLSPAKKGILTFAGLAALALPITLGMLRTPAVRAQSASTGRSTPSEPQGGSISFEVASVKPSRSSDPDGSLDFEKDGRLVAHNVPLKALIAEAYHVRAENLSGAPGWLESERFDVVAKAPPATPPDDLRRMMIALLQERFKLATHIEQKLMPGYSLLVGKKGTNLEKSAPARSVDGGCERARPATPGDVAVQCQNMSMADLADVLPDIAGGYIQGPVVDQTGLQGFYDFRLNWTPAGLLKGNTGGSRNPSGTGSGASVFDAIQDQIGLRLESKKLLLPVVVIDHVERTPTEN